jgi:hypothetical protein
MDRLQLDGDVLVWHVPHLIDINGNHEYLAHGRISGKGYKAVPFKVLKRHGLDVICPGLEAARQDSFGYTIRSSAFDDATCRVPLLPPYLKYVREVASLYDHLAIPFATALICIQPRPWAGVKENSNYPGRWTNPPPERDLEDIMVGLGEPVMEREWLEDMWLAKDDMVITKDFPDVQQWITLLRALLKHSARREKAVQTPPQITALPLRTKWKWKRPFAKKQEAIAEKFGRHSLALVGA